MDHIGQLRQAVRSPIQDLCHGAAHLVKDIREGVDSTGENRSVITRVLLLHSSSSRLSDIGWVVNESCPSCLQCDVIFSKLRWRHHCRACGALVCSECCSVAVLTGFSELGMQRVCKARKVNSTRKVFTSLSLSLTLSSFPGRRKMRAKSPSGVPSAGAGVFCRPPIPAGDSPCFLTLASSCRQ